MNMNVNGYNLHNVNLSLTAGNASQLIKDALPQIAFSGRSNVGKSSLVNNLLGRKKLARVSGEPGKTITVNYYKVDGKFYLVDMPGYGFAKRSKSDIERWSALTQRYFEDNTALKAVLQLVDIKAGLTADDRMMVEWMKHFELPFMIVATKCDRFNKTELDKYTKALLETPEIKGVKILLHSSNKNLGRDSLWELICGMLE